jgi:hypothetical protein
LGVRRGATSALVLTLLVASAACSGAGAHTYGKVNAVADELRLSSIGVVVHQERFGTGKFSSDAPTLFMVISGSRADADVQQAYTTTNFTKDATGTWSRGSGHDLIMAYVDELKPGDTYPLFGADTTATVDAASAAVKITNP